MTNSEQKPIRIGVLIREFETLNNYEYRILNHIISDPELELVLLIKDGRKHLSSTKNRLYRNIFSRQLLANTLFKIQNLIELKIFHFEQFEKKSETIEYLNKVTCIELNPQRKGFLDVFSDEESEIVKSYQLDVILRHEFNIIRGKILDSAKHGIWSFHHGDNAVNRGGPAGFWEIVLNEPCVGVTLQKLTPALDGGKIIDKAYYNWEFSHIVTNHDVLESSVNLLIKNLNKLKTGQITYQNSLVYYNPLYKKPNLKYLFIYLFKFYKAILTKILYRAISIIPNKRRYCWSLFFSKGIFLESQLYKKKEIALPKKEFWADPFLLQHKGALFAFFENYEYSRSKGKISCARIVDNNFVEVTDALNLSYHLSYPFMISEDNEIYMIPETLATKRLEVYKCIEFPSKWELYSTAFENEEVSDTSYFTDENGIHWLFVNKGYKNKPELHIYRVDSLQLNHIESHKDNPVKIDTLISRNGGAIFKYENQYYRPSQVNSYGKYGNGLNINKIIKLNIEEYIEEKIITVYPNFKKGLVGLHHLHQLDDHYIFDVCHRLK
ncbi:MAG TPA: hypothetical protein VFT78_07920 [Hanamia sp.]|nr:hypothetical protein [Hanamia sp.]